eukprot:TRINITY_DN815_c6_g1_i1.p1 TRINITY_DN815_c6_g1~~TRINITY_DN815_c6_g1_i1.p1  ORF type:complete len:618 (+),score=130.25 TRINITY_DN815_c6_g1_i1:51-1856(+)
MSEAQDNEAEALKQPVVGPRGSKEEVGKKRKNKGEKASEEKRRKKEEETARKKKEEERELKLYGGEGPSFQLKLFEEKKIHISIRDVQGLVLWLVGEGESPRWVFVKNKALCKNVVVVVMNSLSLPVFTKYGKECMPFLTEKANFFQVATRLETHVKNVKCNSFMDEFFNKEVKKVKKEPTPHDGGVAATMNLINGTDSTTTQSSYHKDSEEITIPDIPITTAVEGVKEYHPSVEDMMEHGFCVSTLEEETFIATTPSERPLTDDEKIIVIDCEMCLTKDGHELTRLSVLNWKGTVLYDTLVKPANKIVNYLTAYSGITAEMLIGVTTTLAEVQSTLFAKYLSKEVTIIGHSLENDLKALKIVHHNVCDTTMLFPHFQGPPLKSALKYLSIKYLNRGIQGYKGRGIPVESDRVGHDPVEDATAALDLVKLKLEKGRNFGVPSKRRTEPMLRKVEGKSIVLDRPECIGRVTARNCSTDLIPVGSDMEAAKKARKQIASGRYSFTFVHLHLLEEYMDALEWADPMSSSDADEETLKKILTETDAILQRLYEGAPLHTGFIVASGQTNGAEEVEGDSDDAYLRKWDLARQGLCFMGFKEKSEAE